MRETVEDLRVTAPERSLVLEVPEQPVIWVQADRARISQVVTNYVTNALRYALADSPIHIGLTRGTDTVRVWVQDQGPGLSQEVQKNLWQRFHQVKGIPVQGGTGRGLGLGLFIVAEIVKGHGRIPLFFWLHFREALRRSCPTPHETEKDKGTFVVLQRFQTQFLQKRDHQMTETTHQQTKALVLGAGGPTGNAWEVGVLLGLHDEGVDMSDAALVVGTSAGSIVGAQFTSGIQLEEFYRLQLTLQEQAQGQRVPPMDTQVWLRLFAPARGEPDAQTARARVGAGALASKTMSEEDRLKQIAPGLLVQQWPRRQRLVVTAVNAHTGELAQFTRDAGISLEVAIAASSAVPGVSPPITIGTSRYIDGVVRSGTNADLAAGYRRVLILRAETTFDVSALDPQEGIPVLTFEDELAELQRSGSQVLVMTPDEASMIARGPNMLDSSRRTVSAEAGRQQGRALAERVKSFWSAFE